MGRAYLLTGRPGVGKTTCLKKVLELARMPRGGFFTEEMREAKKRVGFALLTLDGRRAVLAHVDRRDGPRVGKYRVNLDTLERVGVPAVREAVSHGRLVVIDEIGKMEMTSPAFRQAVEEALRSRAIVLGTILRTPHPWADRIRADPAVRVVEVSVTNRDALPGRLAGWVASASPGFP